MTVIAVLQMCFANNYFFLNTGVPNLTNYPATRIHYNPSHYCMKTLEKRYIDINICHMFFTLEYGNYTLTYCRLQEPASEKVMSPVAEDVNYPTMTVTQITTLAKDSSEVLYVLILLG